MTTTTDPHRCGVATRSGRPCRNVTSGDPCVVHDPEHWCGADNGHGGTCRRVVEPGRRCDSHDQYAIAQRRAQAERVREYAEQERAARAAAARARRVEVDSLVAALAGCSECLTAALRAVIVVDVGSFDDERTTTPMSVAWTSVVEHLRLGHALVTQ
ncbi:hypothetical protein [Cellulomonas sp. P5_E12]